MPREQVVGAVGPPVLEAENATRKILFRSRRFHEPVGFRRGERQTGYLYETFAGHEITALSLTGGASFDFFGNATNVVAGGGKVYWQDDLRIFMANPI